MRKLNKGMACITVVPYIIRKGNYMENYIARPVGRPPKETGRIVPDGFREEYKKYLSGKYGKITRKQFAKLLGIGASTLNKYINSIGYINSQERKELKTLADDFGLLNRNDVQDDIREIIETCKSYEEGQRRIMEVYTVVYM